MADSIRWGVLSTARIGRKVIPSIQESRNGAVVAVASRDPDKARRFADEVNVPQAYGSYEDLLADPNIDAIYNPLPNDQHAEWSLRAAEAGKAVLCEKPMAATAAEAAHMAEVFAGRGLLLAEAFMYRFHPQTERVQQLVAGGGVGRVQLVASSFSFDIPNEDNIRLFKARAGGALMDIGCYCVSIMRLIAGEEPEAVSAFAEFNADGVDERMVGALAFPSGIFGEFNCSMRSFRANQYEIRGTEGRIFVPESFTMRSEKPTVIHHWHGDDYEVIEIPATNHYTLMAEDFADAMLTSRPPRFDAQDAVKGMALLDRLRASAEANRSA